MDKKDTDLPEAPSAGGRRAEGLWGSSKRPETSVLDGVRRREREALAAFFEYYFDSIYGLAYRLLGNRANAQDAAQDVFCKVHRSAHTLDPQRNPGPWLVTITLNVCRSLWRSSSHKMSKRSVSLEPSTDYVEELKEPSAGPDEEILASERHRKVQDAVQELPETLREVVVLRDYQGLGHKEIAEALGLSHEAVRKRYSRALSELGEQLRGTLE